MMQGKATRAWEDWEEVSEELPTDYARIPSKVVGWVQEKGLFAYNTIESSMCYRK